MTDEAGEESVSSNEEATRLPASGVQGELTGDHQFQALVDAVEEYAIFRLDPQGHIVSWNCGAEAIKGYTQEEILGQHFRTFYTEENRAAGVPEENLAAAVTHGSIEDEGWRIRADGTRFWAYVTITVIRDDEGEIEGFAKVTRDMTERRKHEEQLREERDFTEQVLNTAPASIFVLDASGDVVRANDRLNELLAVDDISGELSVGELTILDEAGEPVPPGERPYQQAFRTGEGVDDWQCQFELPSGERRWMSLNVTPIGDGDEGVKRVVVTAQDVTQLREQAQRLERQRDELESELSEVFERIDEAFFSVDENWRITYLNDRTAELVQLSPGELLHSRVWDVLYEAAEDYPREMAEEAMATQNSVQFEYYSELLDIWVEVRAYPSETGMSVYIRDITERKERERALEESEERYRTLIEHFPHGAVGLFDEDLRYTAVGGQLLEEVGLTPEDRVGELITEVYPDDIIEEYAEYFQAALEGEAHTFEAEFHDRHLYNQTLPVRDPDDEVYAGMLVAQDISERKDRERELAQYKTIIESLSEGVYVVDADRNFQWVNEAYAEMLGYSREDLIGKNATMVVDNEVIREAEMVEEEQGYEHLPRMDVELWTKSGDRVPVDAASTVLPSGEKDGWFRTGVVRDITDRKEYEERLERLVDELEESNERLEQFAQIASHDLQEPLRMVSSYLQLVDDRYGNDLDDDAREFIDYAVDGANRMREMIDDLLDYSRVDTEAEPLQPVDSETVVMNVLRDLELRIQDTGAQIHVGTLPVVPADQNQLEQVFQNLLSNAIKYRGDDPPNIEISAERDGREWLFHVVDNGIGIDPEYTNRIFEVFDRLHTHDEYPGTGIGLALCKKIIERHGGEIWVESAPGDGSTFTFTLPVE